MLRTKGVLSYSDDLAPTIDAAEELPAGPHERALRATAVTAADAIVAGAGGAFTAHELSAYLCLLAEQGQELAGQVKPHLTRGLNSY